MELTELEALLNYKDLRSTKKWCKKNNILIIPMGKQKYVPKKLVEMHLNNQWAIFFGNNQNYPDEISDCIRDDDLSRLAELVGAPATPEVKEEYNQKNTHSKKSEELLIKFRRA
jgi:hypothetical protein